RCYAFNQIPRSMMKTELRLSSLILLSRLVLCALLLAAAATHASAQIKPGRDPQQPVDEEYTRKIREYTTEPYFASPLVDCLPASPTVPTPKAVIGDIAGAPGKLPYTAAVNRYLPLPEQ